jgi:hypothetical protein
VINESFWTVTLQGLSEVAQPAPCVYLAESESLEVWEAAREIPNDVW